MSHVRAGRSLIAFGIAVFVSPFAEAVFSDSLDIDPVALLAILLGIFVLRSSRGAAKWAVAFSVYYLCEAFVVTVAAFIKPHWLQARGYLTRPDAILWLLSYFFVIAAWSTVNLYWLVRVIRQWAAVDSLGGTVPTTQQKRRRWIRIATFALLATGTFGAWLGYGFWHSRTPDHLRPAVIEMAYAKQLARLRSLAESEELDSRDLAARRAENLGLFSSEEILAAGVAQASPHYWTRGSDVEIKALQPNKGWTSWASFVRRPGLDSPVVNIHLREYSNGRREDVLVYENDLLRNDGKRMRYYIEFHLAKLEALQANGVTDDNR